MCKHMHMSHVHVHAQMCMSTLKPENMSSPDATSGGWKAGEPRLLEQVSVPLYLSSVSETPKSETWSTGQASVQA